MAVFLGGMIYFLACFSISSFRLCFASADDFGSVILSTSFAANSTFLRASDGLFVTRYTPASFI